MTGNVFEWTSSLWGPCSETETKPQYGYPYRAGDGREDANSRDCRVLRGGAWSSEQNSARAAYRVWDFLVSRFNGAGFRVVAAPIR
jgi:formylglycine-generating enzyme required for sulfatase activity